MGMRHVGGDDEQTLSSAIKHRINAMTMRSDPLDQVARLWVILFVFFFLFVTAQILWQREGPVQRNPCHWPREVVRGAP